MTRAYQPTRKRYASGKAEGGHRLEHGHGKTGDLDVAGFVIAEGQRTADQFGAERAGQLDTLCLHQALLDIGFDLTHQRVGGGAEAGTQTGRIIGVDHRFGASPGQPVKTELISDPSEEYGMIDLRHRGHQVRGQITIGSRWPALHFLDGESEHTRAISHECRNRAVVISMPAILPDNKETIAGLRCDAVQEKVVSTCCEIQMPELAQPADCEPAREVG